MFHPVAVTFQPFPQPKLVLATLGGCKAELTSVVVISQNSLCAKYGHYIRDNRAVSWLEIEHATGNRESNVLTTTPPSHQAVLDESIAPECFFSTAVK